MKLRRELECRTVIVTLVLSLAACAQKAVPNSQPRIDGTVKAGAKALSPDPARLAALGLTLADVETPRALERRVPAFPQASLRAGVEGTVRLRCVIETSGLVDQCQIVQGLAPDCDDAAMNAAKTWRYTAARVRGKPQAVYVDLYFNFRMRG